MTDEQIAYIALKCGFALSTSHGQESEKLMPISDRQTLIDFAREVIRQTKC